MPENWLNRYNSKDISIKRIEKNQKTYYVMFLIGASDVLYFDSWIVPYLSFKDISEIRPEITKRIEEDEVDYELFSGNLIVSVEEKIYCLALSKTPKRTTGDSKAEAQIALGARDGFTEDIRDNLALLRGRVKTSKLKEYETKVGKISKSMIVVLGLEGICKEENYQKICSIIDKIDMDGIYNTVDVTTQFTNSRIFPVERCSGSPEEAALALCNGQIVILVEKIPVCIISPTSILFASKSKTDGETPNFFTPFHRAYVLISLFLSVFGLGIFVCFLKYQQCNLSFYVICKLKMSQQGLVFPVYIELFFVLFLFDLIQLVGARAPSTVFQVIVLLCGLIIGQNTVESGFVSVFILTISTFCFLSTYAVSNDPRVVMSLHFFRDILIVSTFLFGFLGFFFCSLFLCSYISKKSFMGISFLHPFIPFEPVDIKRFFGSRNYKKINKRPEVLSSENKTFKKIN